MTHWPLNPRPTRVVRQPRAGSAPSTINVTGSSTIHTKGAWVELVASTDSATSLVGLHLAGTAVSGSATDMLVDLAVGAAGSEAVIASNLLAGYAQIVSSGEGPIYLPIPLTIPKASRVAARCQGLIASDIVSICLDLYGGKPWESLLTASTIDTYGANTSNSRGTVVTASGTVNAKGAWTDITTATARPHDVLMILAQPNGRVITASEHWLFDVGLWNGTSYDVIWPDRPLRYSSVEVIIWHGGPPVAPLGFSIPRGSRLGVRGSCNVANVTLDVALYGM